MAGDGAAPTNGTVWAAGDMSRPYKWVGFVGAAHSSAAPGIATFVGTAQSPAAPTNDPHIK